MNPPLPTPPDDDRGELQPGTLLGRYEIVRRLGAGGVGTVYEARHVDLEKRVALKTLHPEYARDPQMRARFLAEGRAASRLSHPHVVDVSDYGVDGDAAFLVMEYLEGEDLSALIAREGPLSIARIVELLVPICAAVAAAHEAGVVHRDLKPENIFLARNGLGQLQPRVLDFGISKVLGAREDGAITGANDLVGTPCYMSPEHARGLREPDALSDQYALGVILFECATGRLPFDADSLYALLRKIGDGVHPTPRALRPELPARFERVVLRAMHRDPARRYPTVRALARDLLDFAPSFARVTWEPVILPPDADRTDDGEDPTATFASPFRRNASHAPRRADPLADTLSRSPRELVTPAPLPSRPRPRPSRSALVIALSALATMAVVGAVALVHRATHPSPCASPASVAPARALIPVTSVLPPEAPREALTRPEPVIAPVAAPAMTARADDAPERIRRSGRAERRRERRHRTEARSGG